MRRLCLVMTAIALMLVTAAGLKAEERWFFDIEGGYVWSGYNDVQISRSSGTRFSLSEDLKTEGKFVARLRLGYRIAPRHELVAFAAPLSLNASGTLDVPVSFFDSQFEAGSRVSGLYRFNSWRLTYRYLLADAARWQVFIGFTAKIRDAEIRIESDSRTSSKTNVGFVPLLHFSVLWKLQPRVGLLLEGDALASPGGQGRAEDVFLGVNWQLNPKIDLRAGYRLIEGGANVEEVYNFALLHFAVAGIRCRF